MGRRGNWPQHRPTSLLYSGTCPTSCSVACAMVTGVIHAHTPSYWSLPVPHCILLMIVPQEWFSRWIYLAGTTVFASIWLIWLCTVSDTRETPENIDQTLCKYQASTWGSSLVPMTTLTHHDKNSLSVILSGLSMPLSWLTTAVCNQVSPTQASPLQCRYLKRKSNEMWGQEH